MKKYLSFMLAGSIMTGIAAFAEEAGNLAEENPSRGEEIQVTFTANVKTQLDQIVKEAGLRKAGRKGKCSFATATAPIGVKPNQKGYATARQVAYERAMLQAKTELARKLAAEISSSAELYAVNGVNDQATSSESNDKLQNLVNSELEKLLTAQGVDLNDPAAIEAALPEVLNSSEFKSATESAAAAYMIGVQAYRTVSDDNSIGVVAVYSEPARQLAMSLFTGEELPPTTPAGDIDEYMESLDPLTVASSFGLRMWADEDGECCIIAYTQAELASSSASSLAMAEATSRTTAEQLFREFAGQNTSVIAALEKSQSIVELDNELGEMGVVNEKSSLSAKAAGEKLMITGIEPLASWTVQLPSGHEVLCTAYYWSPSTKLHADEAFFNNEDAREAAKNATRKRPAKKSEKASKPAPEKQQKTQYKNQGTRGTGATGGFF